MNVMTATDVGLVRANNEDACGVGSRYLVVCDGMGGHSAGEVAARLAVQAVQEFPFVGKDPLGEVRLAIESAQRHILSAAAENPAYNGMGTTITLAYLQPLVEGGAQLTLGHVGDSRGYVYCGEALHQLTQDHSIVGELVRSGTITAIEARSHDQRHMLTQALGSQQIDIELKSQILPPGSYVLLCTDGLTDVIADREIERVLKRASEYENPAQELVDLANGAGGPDNVTVILARV